MPLLPSTKKAEEFARLLEGSSTAGSGSSEFAMLQGLASRLSSVPQPRAEFAGALRERLMSEAVTTLPGAASGAVNGAGSSGAGGTGAGGSSAGGTGSSAASGATSGASSTAGSAGSAATAVTGGTAAGGSAVSAVLGATAPIWAQFAAGVAATAIAIGGVGLGASRSLPGEPLYGVKRQIEAIQLDLAGGRTDTALTQLGLAQARLGEIADLLDGRTAGAPLAADLQRRISELLTDWADETSAGTTVLLDQLSAAQGDLADIRQELTEFTDSSARRLAAVVQQLPDTTLQSFTGSAFAYLQRVDTALGNPVNLATLLPSLGLALPTASSPAGTPSSSPSGSAATPDTPTNGGAGSGSTNTPTSVPTLPIPTTGQTAPQGTTKVPVTPSVPLPTGGSGSLPDVGGVGGAAGRTVDGATTGADQTVNGVLNGVTGKGPSLPLPTMLPTLPGVGH